MHRARLALATHQRSLRPRAHGGLGGLTPSVASSHASKHGSQRRSIAVSSTGPEVLVEILDFGWGWQRVSLTGSTAAAAFRMPVTEGAKTERFTGERAVRSEADSLAAVADQLELALDDAIKALGESTVLTP